MNKLPWLTLIGLLCLHFNASASVREYWVAAEKVQWDYAPSKVNKIKPKMNMGPWGLQLRYWKYRFIQYTDGDFSQPVSQPKSRGILGPEIRAVEGDTLRVHFLNRADKPLSMHPHGLKYDKANEGADGPGKGAAVPAGEHFTYEWEIDKHASPGPTDPSSIVWLYHSHVDSVTEIYDGLIGTIVITKQGMQRSNVDPRPKDIDTSFTALYMIFDENNRAAVDGYKGLEGISNEEIKEGNFKHAINGRIFGNLGGLEMNQGDRVRWHLIGMGTEVDLHTVHWHGQTVLDHGRRTDIVELLPSSMTSVDMLANNPGDWLFHCHVTDHITAGMSTRWHVLKK